MPRWSLNPWANRITWVVLIAVGIYLILNQQYVSPDGGTAHF